MNICKSCKGLGFEHDDICLNCDGEGVLDNHLEPSKVYSSKKPSSFAEYQNKEERNYKFDKKNAQRF